MKPWFLKRGYLNNVIEKEMKKVKFFKISSTRKDNAKGVPLVVTYHPGLKNINQIINHIWIKKLRKYFHQSSHGFFP